MQEFLVTTEAQAVIWTAVLVFLCVLGYYIVGSFRGRSDDNQSKSSELLTNFTEMHHQGDINESEFRTIKTVLGAELQQELKDRDDEG